MSDSDRSSTESSSDSDDHREDFDEAEIKLQQMRRKARAKAEAQRGVGQERMKVLQSYEEMRQEHALKRTARLKRGPHITYTLWNSLRYVEF